MSIESEVPSNHLVFFIPPHLLPQNKGWQPSFHKRVKKQGPPLTRHIFPLLLLILFYVFIYLFIFLPHHVACRILISQPGIEPMSLAVKVQSLNHWTSREILLYFFRQSSPLSVLCCPVYHRVEVFHLPWVLYHYSYSLSLSLLYVLDVIYSPAAAAKSLQSCPTLCDPGDSSPPGSPVPGILQARTLKWVAISFSNAWKWKVKVKSPSHVQLLVTPWTAAYQAPPSMGFSRQEYWSGVPLPSPIHSPTLYQIS